MQNTATIERFNAIPRLKFGHYPTPVEEALRLRAVLGPKSPRIFLKRDDYTGPGLGGNKVRKLEYLLARAVADGVDAVVTCGGVKSNHVRITAAMCARLGLRCVVVLNPAAVSYEGLTPASLAADQWFGAEPVHVSGREERTRMVEETAARLRGEGHRVAVIPLGGSVPLGALGFVRGVRETAAQFEALGVRPRALYHCSSSGGTQAGIRAGCQLFGWADVPVFGVSPDDSAEAIGGEVGRILRGVGDLLGADLDDRVTVLDAFTGAGYGIPSPEGEEALALLARTEGLLLDPVYTAKAMAALLAAIRAGEYGPDDDVLFWHTGGQMALFYCPTPGGK